MRRSKSDFVAESGAREAIAGIRKAEPLSVEKNEAKKRVYLHFFDLILAFDRSLPLNDMKIVKY